MPFDYSKLRGRIKEKYQTQSKFADAVGLSKGSISQRLNNILDFSQSEMEKTADLLNFPKNEIPLYFFTPDVQKGELSKEKSEK